MPIRLSRLRKYCSKAGLLVRSPGELEIANFLAEQGVKFEYEPRIVVNGYGLRPDFYLNDYDIYIEYFGMKDANYCRDAWHKRLLMERSKYRLISLYGVSKGHLGATLKVCFETLLKRKFPQKKYFDWHTAKEKMNIKPLTGVRTGC